MDVTSESLRREDLVGLVFKGFFNRDIKHIVESEEAAEKLKVEDPEEYERGREARESANKRHDFEVHVLDYVPEAGLIIARGKDALGVSGLVGMIFSGKITFTKHYVGMIPSHLIEQSSFREIKYDGSITLKDNVITCMGHYNPVCPYTNYDGIWRLDAVLKK